MRSGLLLLCGWMLAIGHMPQAHGAEAVPNTGPLQLEFDLSDGSRIIGTPEIDQLKAATDYASMEVKLSLVDTIKFGKTARDNVQVRLQNGDLINARLSATEITVKTIFGKAVLHLADVRNIRVTGAHGAILPEGLVLHYPLDTDADDGKVKDTSDSGNDGTIQGVTFSKEGRKTGTMSFSGDHQAVILKNSTSLQMQDFSILAWIKRGDKIRLTRAGFDANAVFFGYGQEGYGLGMKSNDNSIFLSKIGLSHVSSTCQIRDDAWHHVGVTKSGSKIVFFLDGVAYPAPDYNPGFEFETDVAVGARGDGQENGFIGQINEVVVFNRALSEDQIKRIYESQK